MTQHRIATYINDIKFFFFYIRTIANLWPPENNKRHLISDQHGIAYNTSTFYVDFHVIFQIRLVFIIFPHSGRATFSSQISHTNGFSPVCCAWTYAEWVWIYNYLVALTTENCHYTSVIDAIWNCFICEYFYMYHIRMVFLRYDLS